MRRPNKVAAVAALLMANLPSPATAVPSPAPAERPPLAHDLATNGQFAVTQATPVKDRVLTIGALAKRTGEVRQFSLKPGQYVEFAGIRITARTCETTPPWERPALTGAFVQVDEKLGNNPLRRVFSGWLFAQSPSLNAMEHPRYDVWLKACAMNFPDGPALGPSPSSSTKKSPSPTSAAAN